MKFLQTDMTALLGSYHFPQNPLKLKRIQAFKLTRVVAMEKSQTSRHPLSNQTTLKGRKTQHPSSFKSLSSPRSSSSIICRPPLLISLASLLFKKVKGMGRLFKGGGGALDGYYDPWDGSLLGEGHLFEKIRYTYLAATKLKLLP